MVEPLLVLCRADALQLLHLEQESLAPNHFRKKNDSPNELSLEFFSKMVADPGFEPGTYGL